MPLVGLEPTTSSPGEQGYSAGSGTDSGTVTDAGKVGDSKEDLAELPGQPIQLPSWTDLPEGWVTTKGVPRVGTMA